LLNVVHLPVIQSTLPFSLLQLMLLKAVSLHKLTSPDLTELVTLCSVCQHWRSAFDITQRHRLTAVYQCEFYSH